MDFNEIFRERTRNLALAVIRLYGLFKIREETRIIGKQILRCSTSVAANFRAACRARSRAEYFSKMCIVVEECDETLFWFELIEATGLLKTTQINDLIVETRKMLSAFAKTKKTLKENLKK